MPTIKMVSTLPDAKQGELASRFKYGMFGHRMHDYDIKNKTLSLAMFGMETSVISAYHTTRLIRYLWEQIRSAFKVKTQRIYDSYFDKLVDMSYEALIEYNHYAARCYPNKPQPAFFIEKNVKLTKVIRGAYRQLNSLTDRSGFGNKMIKDFSAEQYSKRNMME
jgi:hypothetical protein